MSFLDRIYTETELMFLTIDELLDNLCKIEIERLGITKETPPIKVFTLIKNSENVRFEIKKRTSFKT